MANNFILPQSTQTISLARLESNDSAESLLDCFYSEAEPIVTKIVIDGVSPSSLPNGMLFRSALTGRLYQKAVNHQTSAVHGGGFTRNGIGAIIEPSLSDLYANVALNYYENGELIVIPSNNSIYLKVGTNPNQTISSIVDLRIPAGLSVSTGTIQTNAVTTLKINDLAVTTAKLDSRATTNLKMATDTISIHEMNESSAGFGNLLRRNSGNSTTQDLVNVHFASNNVRLYTKQQYFKSTSLSVSGAATTWNLDNQQVADILLSDPVTTLTFSNFKAGGTYVLRIRQDPSGSRSIIWNGTIAKWIGGAEPTLTTTGNALDVISFTANAISMFGVASLAFS